MRTNARYHPRLARRLASLINEVSKMPSANGFGLDVTVAGKAFVLTASWAAPYFVMITGVSGSNDTPYVELHHCEDLAHAKRIKADWSDGHRKILNADFTEYTA